MILSLLMVQVLARGMTSPLREMAAASRAMARGDYGKRVTASSNDEVGELARAFNKMAGDLEQIDRIRKDLVANVSHELRTPLGALQAVLENIIDGIVQPEKEALTSMHRQVERLSRLVEQLLDLSRLESGSSPLQPQSFEVAPVLQLATDEALAYARNRMESDVQFVIEAPEDLELVADPDRIHQVTYNLVSNAVRHSPPGGRIRVAASKNGRAVRIEVCDEGLGIPPEEAARVFERFYRSDSGRSASDGGAGLGLAIAQWIVDLHGGEIRAEQAAPRGCRIVVELPQPVV